MPTRPFTAQELEDAELAMMLAHLKRRRRWRGEDYDAAEGRRSERILLALAAEVLSRSMRSSIGPESLSVARLQ